LGNLEELYKIWEWIKKKLTTEDINNKILLGTENEGRIPGIGLHGRVI